LRVTTINQTITLWQGGGLIATTLLGTGVFILPQLTLEAAGNNAFWAWLILLIAILPLTYIFAELGRRFTHAAGPAYFVQHAFGKIFGQAIGLLFLFIVPPGVTAALIMTLEFLKPLVLLTPQQRLCIELLIIIGLFFVNRRGLQLSGNIQLVLTLLILCVVIAMLFAFLLHPPVLSVPVSAPFKYNAAINPNGIMSAIGLAIWSFLGIEAITHLAGEFKHVKRDFIPASLGGVILVGMIFMACTWLSTLAPDHSLAMVGAFELLLGDSGRWVIGGLGLISGIATINVYFASLSGLACSFSHDGVLPASLKKVNNDNIPTKALQAFMIISILILLISYCANLDFVTLAHWVNGGFVLIYSASMLSAWKLLPSKLRPAIIASLLACCLFIYCLGSSMIYAISLAIVIIAWLKLKSFTQTIRAN